jgi:hypothetical protein
MILGIPILRFEMQFSSTLQEKGLRTGGPASSGIRAKEDCA